MWGQQGCILSSTLFALFVDDLVQALNYEDKGVVFGDSMLTALLYADDIVLTAPNENKLQGLLGVVENWCRTWCMSLNIAKTNIVHFRRKCKGCTRSKFIFKYQGKTIQYTCISI